MPKSRSKHRQKTQSAEFQHARAAITKSRNVRRGLGRYKLSASIGELRRTVSEFVAHPAYRPLIWPNIISRDYAHISGTGLHTNGDIVRELEWVVQTLLPFSQLISSFLELRRKCEIALLVGTREQQNISLQKLEQEFGVSLWLLQTKMNLIQRTSGLAERKRFADELISDSSVSFPVKFIVNWLSFRFEQSVSIKDFNRALEQHLPDSGYFNLVRIILGACPRFDKQSGGEALAFTDFMPLVDRYLYSIAVVQAYVAGASCLEDIEPLATPLGLLARKVDDPGLRRLALVCGYHGAPRSNTPNLLPALDRYSSGDNLGAMELTKPIVEQDSSIDALQIYLRAAAYEQIEPNLDLPPGSLLADICTDLNKVIVFASDAPAASSRLSKIAINNSHCSWSSTLDLVALRQSRDERVFQPGSRQIFDALRALQETPALAFCFDKLGASTRYIEALTHIDPNSLTCRSASLLLREGSTEGGFGSLAAAHRHKLEVAKALRNGRAADALSVLEPLYNPIGNSFQQFETALLMAECLLQAGQLERCAQVCADTFLKSNYLGSILPVESLINALLKEEERRSRSEYFLGKLPIAIIFDVYSRQVSSSRDPERADAFKDFLKVQGVKLASELIARASEFPRDQLIYFLRYVCVPEVLDQSLVLQNSRDVEDERAKILVQLNELFTEISEPPPPALMEELQTIRTRQVIRDTTLQLDQSKIYVDLEGIKKSIDSQLREEWQQYRLLCLRRGDGTGIDDVYKILQDAIGEKFAFVSLSLPLTERNKLFEHMVATIRDLFATNRVFGLDANLSTNIRHGFILRELRKPFITSRLVTNRPTQSSEYEPNNHWLERAGFGIDETKLSNALNRFSAAVDAEIDILVTKVLRIKSDQAPEGLFDFSISHPQLHVLQRVVDDAAEGHDELFDIVAAFLWQCTNVMLEKVRKELFETTLNHLQTALNMLEREIESIENRWQHSGLLAAINLVRPEVRSAVQRVASWFTLSESREFKDYPLKIAFDAGVATVSSYYYRVRIEAELSAQDVPLLSGWTLPCFTRIFSIIVENAAVHSGIREGRLDLKCEAGASSGTLEIKIGNQLSSSIDMQQLNVRVAKLNAEFGRDASFDFVRREGNSGYPKIWKILTHDLGRSHELAVSIEEGPQFVVQILMNTEGITV